MELMMTYETTLERLVDRIVQRQYLLNQDPISDFDRAVRICGQTQACHLAQRHHLLNLVVLQYQSAI